jgi:hypothetical protein
MFDRMRRGWELTKRSWGVVRTHPGLVRLPLTGGIVALAVTIVLVLPGVALWAMNDSGAQAGGIILIVAGAYLASFAVIYFNVALAAAASEALAGHQPDLSAARAVARSRIGVIASWAAVSALVSLFFAVLRDRLGAAGGIAARLGAAIWSLVTFLVVPVLAFEGIGPLSAIKRSTTLFRERWGQQVTGNVVIGGIGGLVVLLGVATAVGGIALTTLGTVGAQVGGVVLVLVGALVAVTGAVFTGATRGVFGVALYRYVADDTALAPFTAADFEGIRA